MGTTSATWSKIKLAANGHPDRKDAGPSDSAVNGDTIEPNGILLARLIERGPNDEVLLFFDDGHMEVWKWYPRDRATPVVFQGEAFYHHWTILLRKTTKIYLVAVRLLKKGELLILFVTPEGVFWANVDLQARTKNVARAIPGTSASDDFVVKVSNSFAVVGEPDGTLHTLSVAYGKLTPLTKASCPGILLLMPDSADDELRLRTCVLGGRPIVDVAGNWLVYSPTHSEYQHLKQVHASDKSSLTPVKLPPPGPMLNQIVSSLSNITLDGLFRLSEVGSRKVSRYIKGHAEDKDVVISLNSIGKVIGNALYLTASTIQKTTKSLATSNHEIIKIVDLRKGTVIATFKPPGGVSSVSLSPYDLLLVNANFRGDNLFTWDLCKFPREVSLVGKFVRGKTSAVVKEIVWFIERAMVGDKPQSNSGFGCITKKSGTVHWYNVNYLTGSNNYPHSLGGTSSHYSRDEFLDLWILSSFRASQFLILPDFSNAASSQLAVVDTKGQVRPISTLNGYHAYKYQLPSQHHEEDGPSSPPSPVISPKAIVPVRVEPLSQTEIETCVPYPNLINCKNVQFCTYDFDSDNDAANVYDIMKSFGDPIPMHVIDFDRGPASPNLVSEYGPTTPEDLIIEVAGDAK